MNKWRDNDSYAAKHDAVDALDQLDADNMERAECNQPCADSKCLPQLWKFRVLYWLREDTDFAPL